MHTPYGAAVEHVSSFKFFGIHISDDLTWFLNFSILVKKTQQHLYFLQSLKTAHLSPRILGDFYHSNIESILTSCNSVWYGNCSASDHTALQQVLKSIQRITGTQLSIIENICHHLTRAKNIIKDVSSNFHPPPIRQALMDSPLPHQ